MIILVIIACIIALFLLIALVSGKQMNIERSITINKPVAEVFEFIRYLRNHDQFNVWAMMDPDMKKTYRGTDGQEGAVFGWDSAKERNVGAGEQEIKKITPGQRIDWELRFFRPMQDVCQAHMTTTAAGQWQTTVKWTFQSTMKFPMNVMKPLIQGMLAKNLQKGLDNLKTVLEK